METNYINIIGNSIKLTSNSKYFNDFVVRSSNCNDISLKSAISINIFFNDKIFIKKTDFSLKSKVTEYLGSEIYMSHDKMLWDTKKLKIYIEKSENSIVINVIANFRLDQKIRLLFISKPEFLYNMFIYVHRFAILYPICSIFSNTSSLIHASAVYDKVEKKSILFIGLNGVGKSSLAFGLSKHERYSLLSDNYVLINEYNMKIVPELIRLPVDTKLSNKEKNKIVGKANNKMLLEVDKKYDQSYKVGKLVFVSREVSVGKSTFIRLESDSAFDLLCNLGSYLKEYENHHYTAFFGVKKHINDIKNYQQLINNSISYNFKIGDEENIIPKFLQYIEG